jgi:hypothetical protein
MTLHFDGIGVGEFWLRSRSASFAIKSVEWGGQDYTTRPFDAASTASFSGVTITVTDRLATVSGSVKDKGAMVLIFPVEQSLWTNFGFNPPRIRTRMPDDEGNFSIAQLPAGDYFVMAVPRDDQYGWLEPGYFSRAWTQASRLTLDWGDHKTMTLAMARVPR